MPNVAEEYLTIIEQLASYSKHFINLKNNDTSQASENIELFHSAIASMSDETMDKIEGFMNVGKNQ